MSRLAVTWWGHATATVEIGGVRVGTDPLLASRLAHLGRHTPDPGPAAVEVDLVLVSHLHADHLHRPSLRAFHPDVPVLVPRGAEPLLRGLGRRRTRPVGPGERFDLGGVRVTVLPATHDGRRGPHSRVAAPPLGFRVERQDRSFWFPGDTELRDDMCQVAPVDLALVPVGGWGPTLGHGHMDPEAGAVAVRRVGARVAVPVHWGTFWPLGLRRLAPRRYERLFVTPGQRFAAALAGSGIRVIVARQGERWVL